MRHNKYIFSSLLALAGAALLFGGCKKNDDLVAPQFDRELKLLQRQKSPVDAWIVEEFNKPYNIQVIWKWDTKEAGYNRNYIPPVEDNVKPFLTMLKQTFIKTYEENMGKAFIKPLIPKQFLLLGEWGYQFGSRTLAQAEAGSKFVFYGVNYWDQKYDDFYPGMEYPFIREAVHTMYHEFGHILHQNKKFTEEFEKVSGRDYTVRWTDFNEIEARVKGFMSNYSMLNHNEDFVELIAFYTTLTPEQWDARMHLGVEAAENGVVANPQVSDKPVDKKEAAEGLQAIKTKIAMVKEYLKSSWNIDLDEIRDAALKNAEDALKNPEILPQGANPTPSTSMAPMLIRSPYSHNQVSCACGGHSAKGVVAESDLVGKERH